MEDDANASFPSQTTASLDMRSSCVARILYSHPTEPFFATQLAGMEDNSHQQRQSMISLNIDTNVQEYLCLGPLVSYILTSGRGTT